MSLSDIIPGVPAAPLPAGAQPIPYWNGKHSAGLTAPLNPAIGDRWTDISVTPHLQKEWNGSAWNVLTGAWGSLNEMADVTIFNQQPNDSLVWDDKMQMWKSAKPVASIPDWSASMTYNSGNYVHEAGRFWRCKAGTSRGVKPEIPMGAAVLMMPGNTPHQFEYIHVGAAAGVKPTEVPLVNVPHFALNFVDGTNWQAWQWTINSTTRAWEWMAITIATPLFWRNIGLPPPSLGSAAGSGLLWIYDLPKGTATPVKGQNDWEPILLGDFLISLADVQGGGTANSGDALVADGLGKWITSPRMSAVPATATSPGVPGDVAADATHIYMCIAPNTWVRSTAATW